MEQSELLRQKSDAQSRLSHSRRKLLMYEDELERLQIAKNNMIEVIEESVAYKRKLMQLDINPSLWQGTTQNKYQDKMHTIDRDFQSYLQKIREVESAIEVEIRRVMHNIESCRSDISYYQSRISNLSYSILSIKEG